MLRNMNDIKGPFRRTRAGASYSRDVAVKAPGSTVAPVLFALSRFSVVASKADLLLLQKHVTECDDASDRFPMLSRVAWVLNRFVSTRFVSSVVILGTIVVLACLAAV